MSMYHARAAAFVAATLLCADAARAQDSPPSRLSVHGYLTQAYGQSERGLVMGLSEEGTTDYRRAAVVARYAFTPKDALVVQLANRRLGDSPTMEFEEDGLKLDMAFYERRFDTGTRLRVGKSVLPYGIYNEIRYAGPLLPFYRAPFTFYAEGTYSSETIDGVIVSQAWRAGEPWEVTLDGYAGNFALLEFAAIPTGPTTASYVGAEIQAKNALGGQLWISTPVSGLRLGASGRTEEHFGGVFPRPNGISATTFAGSLDGSFERWQLRAEASRIKTYGVIVETGYAQLGVRPRSWLGVNAQMEHSDFKFDAPPTEIEMARDVAAGVNFYFTPLTVLKLEWHHTKGFAYEEVVNMSGPPIRGSYLITSFSVAF
jgi:hypothetical protein